MIPNHRGDAINCMDLVADAVEIATGLDDRWYGISGLTWEKRPDRPEMHVWIGQSDLEDVGGRRKGRRRRVGAGPDAGPPDSGPLPGNLPGEPPPWKRS